MKSLAVLLCGTIVVLAAAGASAMLVGINPNIHNGTDQDAYDFHLEGVIKSTTPPQQVADIVFSAIREKKFYILPNAEQSKPLMQMRIEDILQERNPSPLSQT